MQLAEWVGFKQLALVRDLVMPRLGGLECHQIEPLHLLELDYYY
jgi:hypothetical protein